MPRRESTTYTIYYKYDTAILHRHKCSSCSLNTEAR